MKNFSLTTKVFFSQSDPDTFGSEKNKETRILFELHEHMQRPALILIYEDQQFNWTVCQKRSREDVKIAV